MKPSYSGLLRPAKVAAWIGVAILGAWAVRYVLGAGALQFVAVAWWQMMAAALAMVAAAGPWLFLSDVGQWTNSSHSWRRIILALAGLIAMWAVTLSLLGYLVAGEGWLR